MWMITSEYDEKTLITADKKYRQDIYDLNHSRLDTIKSKGTSISHGIKIIETVLQDFEFKTVLVTEAI